MSDLNSKYFAYSCLALLGLWLVAEYIFVGHASAVPTANGAEMVVPAMLSERFIADTGALWQNITDAGADKEIFTYYGNIDTFLFTNLPGWLAHGLRVSSVFIAAVLGAYVVSRKILELGRTASLFVAAAYSVTLPGQMMAASMGYLPVLLLALFFVLENKKSPGGWIVLGGALYVYADTTYFSQMIPWSLATIIFWYVFADTRKAAGDWAVIAASCLILLLLRVDTFLALFANAPLSYIGLARTVPDLLEKLTESVIHPYFLSGPVATTCFILFVYGLSFIWRNNEKQKINRVALMGAALLIGAFLYPMGVSVQILAVEYLPFLKGYRMGYANRIPLALLPFAAGYGVDSFVQGIRKSKASGRPSFLVPVRWLVLVLCVLVLGYTSIKMKYSSLYNWVTNGSYAHNFESPVIQDLAKTIRNLKVPVRVESFQMIPNYLHAYGIETAGGYQALHLMRYYEFWAKMAEPWATSLTPASRFYPQYAERRKMSRSDVKFRDDRLWLFPDTYQPEWELSKLYNLNFLSLANVGYVLSRDRLTDPSLKAIREMPRPWSALSKRERTRINIRGNFTGREHVFIYENKNVFPRFFTVNNIKTFKTGKATLAAMAEASITELRSTAFVANDALPPGLSTEKDYEAAEIRLNHYESDEIRLDVKSEGPSVLIVNNSFSPFWKVEIDGKPGKVFPAYHAFWGVHLPQGAKSVVFRYDPPYR